MAKKFRYQVVCTRSIATEMCRYEHATITDEILVKASPLTDETYDDDKYRFTIESPNFVPLRWKSFCVAPEIL